MILYSTQIYLRNILNSAHANLHGVNHSEEFTDPDECYAIRQAIDDWCSMLPVYLVWDDSDPPAKDINIARLRAKYYGARYVILRPVLYHCLQVYSTPKQSFDDAGGSTSCSSPLSRVPSEMARACRQCINAAIQSTIAFDNVPGGRPIVTNIFGTAHG